MSILNIFRSKNEIERLKYKLPIELKNQWFAIGRHSEEKLPPNFDTNGKFIDYKIGDYAPLRKLPDNKFAFYKIVSASYRSGDWLYDSDGWYYDCVFSHIETDLTPNLQP